MILLHHPSRYYIHYLLSRRSLGPKAIVATLAELRLPVPIYLEEPPPPPKKSKSKPKKVTTHGRFLEEIQRVQQSLVFPPRYNPLDREHQPTQQFLKKLGVMDFWRQDPYTMTAFEYLREPHLCRMIQVMLLGPLGLTAISRRLAEKFEMSHQTMNPQVIRAFSHYFWNYDNLNKAEWEGIFWEWVQGDTYDMHLAVRAPRSSVGAAMALNIADQGGSESLKEVFQYRHGRDTSFVEMVKCAISLPIGVGKAQAMLAHTQAMILYQEQLDMRRGGSAELLEELRRIEATYDPRRLTTVHELPLHQLPAGYIDAEYEDVSHDYQSTDETQ